MRIRLHDIVAGEQRALSPALTSKDVTLSYGELAARTMTFGNGLVGVGLQRDQRVAIYLDKRIETVVSIFGTSVAGGVFVPVNPLLRPRQVAYILNDCGVRILVTSADRFEVLRPELAECKSVDLVILLGTGRQPAVAAGPQDHYEILWWDELGEVGQQSSLDERRGIDIDMAAILYTSGSTGRPKGVVLSHRNLLAGAESVSHYIGNTASDRILAVLPLSFDAGLSQLTTGFSSGAHVVLTNYLLPRDVVRLCAKHAITGLTAVPPLWIQLAEQTWPVEAASSVRYFANTGGRLARATLDALRTIFPTAKPYLMYGLTEAFRSTYLDPIEVDRRPDSIGKAIPNAEILVVRPDGRVCLPGEKGELVHRGALVSMGYWNDPERTAERFRPVPGSHGELCTSELAVWSGDIVVKDEDGFLYFVGRKDEMIKVSGYRVSPAEIEEVVYETGLVRDAVALGIDDPQVGQRICLVVSGRDGSEFDPSVLLGELRQRLPLYMVPTQIVIRPTLPCSPNGKFDRALLRQELVGTPALEES